MGGILYIRVLDLLYTLKSIAWVRLVLVLTWGGCWYLYRNFPLYPNMKRSHVHFCSPVLKLSRNIYPVPI